MFGNRSRLYSVGVLALVLGLVAGSTAGSLSTPTKYSLSASQKSTILDWLNTASSEDLTSAYLSSSAVKKALSTRPYANWDAMWTTTSIGSNTTVQYALIKLAIYGPLMKKATTLDVQSSDKTAIMDWVNSASKSSLDAAGLSATSVKKILAMRPYRDFEHLWHVSSVGSNTSVKQILIAINLYTNPYDYQKTKAPLRVRVGDRTKMISWVKNASENDIVRLGFSTSGATKIRNLRANPSSVTWKRILATFSDVDLKKIGIDANAIRYVSGSKAIERISGIGTVYGQKMRNEKIFSVQGLLMAAVWPEWRSELAQKTGIAEALIVRFAKRADLDRITNVGEQYGDLLAWAGVETVPELASADPVALRDAMIEKNVQYNLVNTMPSLTSVKGWVTKAKALPKVLEL